jgi:two-component system OmpR family response regulator
MAVSHGPILLVDDEPDVLETLGMVLERGSYAVATAGDAAQALRLADETDFYVALVDYRLVGSPMDGLELIARLQDINPLTVCLLITVYNKGAVGFRAARAGAFNYLSKPFSNQALLAAVRAALAERLRRERMRDRLYLGDLLVDVATRRVVVGTEELSLSRQEFDLLVYLVNHADRVVNYEELWKMVWRYDGPVDKGTIQKALSRLRKKVGGERVVCVRGEGYRLVESPS